MAVLSIVGCATPETQEASPPHLLLISLDALRGDHLSCAGYDRHTTPFLDELAASGVRFSYASVNTSRKIWLEYVARIEDQTRLRRAIEKLRKQCDFVVATMHAGIEYVPKHYGPQQLFARAAIRFGADIVLAAHPHVVQDMEIYRGKYIFYSLGNFIFDHTRKHTTDGLAVKTVLKVGPGDGSRVVDGGVDDDTGRARPQVELDRLELIPVVIENQSTPRPADEAESATILKRLGVDQVVLRPPE